MIAANTCPYCGGPYSITESCNGPRIIGGVRGQNACPQMRFHERLVYAAAMADLTEAEEVEGDS